MEFNESWSKRKRRLWQRNERREPTGRGRTTARNGNLASGKEEAGEVEDRKRNRKNPVKEYLSTGNQPRDLPLPAARRHVAGVTDLAG